MALWSIPQDGSPGLDGFSASFYQSCWEIVKVDLLNLAIEFFNGSQNFLGYKYCAVTRVGGTRQLC